jgi:hypothetical protein
MKNLVILFALLGALVMAGTGCRPQMTPYSNNSHYYGKTKTHYGYGKKMHIKHAYWGHHKNGHKGHQHRGAYR